MFFLFVIMGQIQALPSPVLIIKTAWGGKSLNDDYRAWIASS